MSVKKYLLRGHTGIEPMGSQYLIQALLGKDQNNPFAQASIHFGNGVIFAALTRWDLARLPPRMEGRILPQAGWAQFDPSKKCIENLGKLRPDVKTEEGTNVLKKVNGSVVWT